MTLKSTNSGGPSKIAAIVALAVRQPFLASLVLLPGTGLVLALEHDQHRDLARVLLVLHCG